jgi:hypothetical protein
MKKQELKQLIKEEIVEILGKNLSNKFNIGEKVKVNDREGFKELIGLTGTIIGKDSKKGRLDIDFGKKIIGSGFETHDLDGLLDIDTGLSFFDRGWISSKIDPRFDIRNLTKL